MWLKRAVAIVMIMTCIGLNVIVLLGIILPNKAKTAVASAKTQQVVTQSSTTSLPPVPTLTLTSNPSTIAAGASSGLSWTSTGNPTACVASGSWSGDKTAFGSESTGRISSSGNYTYTLNCSNAAGKAEASTTVTVGNAPAPAKSNTSSTTATVQPAAVYCGGRQPCYSAKEIAAHATSGNCWGWNGDRVINISGFDAAYHIARSGISSIEVVQVCGKDLAPSLNGQVSAGGQTRVHNQNTKTNSDANEIPYFVGYYDASKP